MALKRRPDREEAERIAIGALAFLAQDPDRLACFLDLTGLRPDTLRTAAREPHFLSRVLDHVAEDETLLIEAAAQQGLAPERIAEARALLDRAGLAPVEG